MTKPAATDDFEAVRIIVSALQSFKAEDQERILRWAREKIGLETVSLKRLSTPGEAAVQILQQRQQHSVAPKDIKTFVAEKQPKSDAQFAATVAYYHRFEAPETQQKPTIQAEDLADACRKANRERLRNPLATLNNAHRDGLLDRGPDRGSFQINSVGENLVAMVLPAADGVMPRTRRRVKKAVKKAAKK